MVRTKHGRIESNRSVSLITRCHTSPLLPQAPVDIDKGVYILVHIMLKVTCNSHEEVVWLDVSVDEILGVDVLDPGYQLVCQEEHCLQAEASAKTIGDIVNCYQWGSHQHFRPSIIP